MSPVIDVAHEAAASAAQPSRATRIRASSHPQPVPTARAVSCAHHLAALAETNAGMRDWGSGAPTARTAAITAIPAIKAAAISIIEAVEQTRRIGDLRKLGPHSLWHRRRGTDAVPAAIRAKRDQLLQQRASVIETRDAAHRKKLSLPRLID